MSYWRGCDCHQWRALDRIFSDYKWAKSKQPTHTSPVGIQRPLSKKKNRNELKLGMKCGVKSLGFENSQADSYSFVRCVILRGFFFFFGLKCPVMDPIWLFKHIHPTVCCLFGPSGCLVDFKHGASPGFVHIVIETGRLAPGKRDETAGIRVPRYAG